MCKVIEQTLSTTSNDTNFDQKKRTLMRQFVTPI
jgi:hypothetical protein